MPSASPASCRAIRLTTASTIRWSAASNSDEYTCSWSGINALGGLQVGRDCCNDFLGVVNVLAGFGFRHGPYDVVVAGLSIFEQASQDSRVVLRKQSGLNKGLLPVLPKLCPGCFGFLPSKPYALALDVLGQRICPAALPFGARTQHSCDEGFVTVENLDLDTQQLASDFRRLLVNDDEYVVIRCRSRVSSGARPEERDLAQLSADAALRFVCECLDYGVFDRVHFPYASFQNSRGAIDSACSMPSRYVIIGNLSLLPGAQAPAWALLFRKLCFVAGPRRGETPGNLIGTAPRRCACAKVCVAAPVWPQEAELPDRTYRS
jgi:hypothetical protein